MGKLLNWSSRLIIAAGWHIYSLTQKTGGPVRSKITVESGRWL